MPRVGGAGHSRRRGSREHAEPACAKAPPGGAGRGIGGTASVGVLARPGPDQSVAFAVLVIEQVRVDRRIERGIVELE